MTTMLAERPVQRLSPRAIDGNDATSVDGLAEFLTFTIGREEYGVDILRVQEIRGYTGVTRLPGTPSDVMGVINLRGTIVPVIDLRLRLSRSTASYDETTVMVIVTMGERVVGMVVDAVSDVTRLSAEQIRPAPEMGNGIDTRLLQGLGAIGERMIILFDIDSLLAGVLAIAADVPDARHCPTPALTYA